MPSQAKKFSAASKVPQQNACTLRYTKVCKGGGGAGIFYMQRFWTYCFSSSTSHNSGIWKENNIEASSHLNKMFENIGLEGEKQNVLLRFFSGVYPTCSTSQQVRRVLTETARAKKRGVVAKRGLQEMFGKVKRIEPVPSQLISMWTKRQ